MNPKNRPSQNPSTNHQPELTPEIISQFLENQKQQFAIKQQELIFQEKEMQAQSAIAHKSLEIQGELMKNKPKNDRKMLLMIIGGVILVLLLLLVFFCYCMQSGNKDFAFEMIKILGYPLVGGAGYVAGKRSKNKNPEQPDIPDADVVG